MGNTKGVRALHNLQNAYNCSYTLLTIALVREQVRLWFGAESSCRAVSEWGPAGDTTTEGGYRSVGWWCRGAEADVLLARASAALFTCIVCATCRASGCVRGTWRKLGRRRYQKYMGRVCKRGA